MSTECPVTQDMAKLSLFVNKIEALSLQVRGELGDSMRGARRLAQESYSRGSLDNVTVLVIDLRDAK